MWFEIARGCVVLYSMTGIIKPDVDVLAIIVGIVGAAFFDLGIRRLEKVGITTNTIDSWRVTAVSMPALAARVPLPLWPAAANRAHGLHDYLDEISPEECCSWRSEVREGTRNLRLPVPATPHLRPPDQAGPSMKKEM